MTTPHWWQDAICYQIYPRSFADSNGDGIANYAQKQSDRESAVLILQPYEIWIGESSQGLPTG